MKKFLSIVVLVCIIASVCSVSAFAANYDVSDQSSLETALISLVAGDTITLTANIDLDKSISLPACTINAGAYKFILAAGAHLDGGNSTLNSSADRAINVDANGDVSISNLTINAPNVERAINVINQPANLTLTNVNASASHYTINVVGTSTGSTITINGGDYSGLNVLNIHGQNTHVEAYNATFTTKDNSSAEGYGTITVAGAGSTVALGSCKVEYKIEAGDTEKGSTFTSEIGDPSAVLIDMGGNSYILNEDGNISDFSPHAVEQKVAIDYNNGSYYTFSSLADAINFASPGQTIRLMQDLDLGGQKIPVNKGITIAADGHKITNGTFVVDPSVDSTFDITGLGNLEQKAQLMSGQLPAAPVPVPGVPAPVPGASAADSNPYGVPSTGSERDTALMISLAVLSGSVLLFSLRRKKEA